MKIAEYEAHEAVSAAREMVDDRLSRRASLVSVLALSAGLWVLIWAVVSALGRAI